MNPWNTVGDCYCYIWDIFLLLCFVCQCVVCHLSVAHARLPEYHFYVLAAQQHEQHTQVSKACIVMVHELH